MEEVELTEEELSQIEGRDVEDAAPVRPEAVELLPLEREEEPEAPVSEGEEPAVLAEETKPEVKELEDMKKANAGLLNELVRTRRSAKDDREWRQAVESRMELLTNKLSAEEVQPEQAAEPDKDEDPVGWLAWNQQNEIAAALEPVKEQEEQFARQQQYGQLLAEAGRAATRAEEEFINSTEITRDTYQESLDELRYDRLKWYSASGVQPQDAVAIVEEEERQFVLNALSQNLNPAAEIMRMHSAVKPGKIPGREAAPEEAAPEAKPVLNKVVAAKQGAAEGGLQNVSGSGGAGSTITAEQFADMKTDDPIYNKIASSEKLFAELNIYGQVTV